MELQVFLSGRCNLRCAYCYQNARRGRPLMSRAVAKAALRVVLAAGEGPHRVILSGGEPFLARALLHEVIGLVRQTAASSAPITCTILTNGTLVEPEDLEFLAANDVGLQVSFDGVASAQALRAPDTFERVERLLERAVRDHPRWARRRLAVAVTLQGAAVPTLGESVRHLLARGIRDVYVDVLTSHDTSWTDETRERLRDAVETILELSLEHWEATGKVPVAFLRASRPERADEPSRTRAPGRLRFVCAAPSERNVAVDPDGHAWGCPTFVASVQDLSLLGESTAAGLDLGDVRDPEFPRRLAALPRTARSLELLTGREKKWSSRGRCHECADVSECFVCPVSTARIPGNRDPHRIPDNQCDFQRATIEARRRFQKEINAPGLLRDLQRENHALRRLVEALGRKERPSPAGRAGA